MCVGGEANQVNCVVWCELLHPRGEELMVGTYFIGRQSVCDSVAMEDSYVCSSHYNVMRWRKDRIVDIIWILKYRRSG